ncbi:MAG: hypothetical protein Ct9H300mP29_6660 [Candidatus Neomarinimicrobiota bacterium]|nr:MAG: hypothetical protein Ct9H300mP29_6660 [Candidatus Neomarinimicrobiota bacterium]
MRFPILLLLLGITTNFQEISQSKDLLVVLGEAEDYAVNELMAVIAKRGIRFRKRTTKSAREMARYSGFLKKKISYNLEVPTSFFLGKNFLEKKVHVGRLDSRIEELIKKRQVLDLILILTDFLASFFHAGN